MEKNPFVIKSGNIIKKIDVIQEGAIFTNGYKTVNDTHLNGSFLITFNSTTTINNIPYSNLDHKLDKSRKYKEIYLRFFFCSNFVAMYHMFLPKKSDSPLHYVEKKLYV